MQASGAACVWPQTRGTQHTRQAYSLLPLPPVLTPHPYRPPFQWTVLPPTPHNYTLTCTTDTTPTCRPHIRTTCTATQWSGRIIRCMDIWDGGHCYSGRGSQRRRCLVMAVRGVVYVSVVRGSKDITLIYFCIRANFRTCRYVAAGIYIILLSFRWDTQIWIFIKNFNVWEAEMVLQPAGHIISSLETAMWSAMHNEKLISQQECCSCFVIMQRGNINSTVMPDLWHYIWNIIWTWHYLAISSIVAVHGKFRSGTL